LTFRQERKQTTIVETFMKLKKINSVRYKILLIAIIALIGFVVNLAFNYSVTNANAKRLKSVQDIYFPILESTDSSLVNLDKIKETLNAAVAAGELDMLQASNSLAVKMRGSFTKIRKLDTTIQSDIQQLEELFETYYKAAETLTKGMIEGSLPADQIKSVVDTMGKALKEFQSALDTFKVTSYDRFTATLAEANDASETALITGIIITVIVMFIVGFIAYFISNLISRNIFNIIESLQDMVKGNGDLTKRLTTKSTDDIGVLVDSFNQFVEKLQYIIREVYGSTTQLAAAAEEMSAITVASTDNVRKQQRETEQVATAMNEMTATVVEVSKNAEQAADNTSEADTQAQEGRRIVNDTVESINSLASEVDSAANVIHELEQNSESIGSVLEVIRGIAEQTNLLALNAAIEAARAGEQGRGFAVVADEVRSLASRTQQSTQEIQSMIERLQTGAQKAVEVMNTSRTRAQSSVEKSGQAGDSLTVITQAMSNITAMNTQIAEASKQQSEVAEEINQNIVNISAIAEESASSTSELSQSNKALAELSSNLQDLVGQFKI